MSETGAVETATRREDGLLVLVCGLPGVGKTTVASTIAERIDGAHLRTDVIRKELVPEPEYTPAETQRVYEEMLERARDAVEAGGSVVVDGTFKNQTFRERAVETANAGGSGFRMVKVECSTDVVRRRIANRENDASDADFEVHTMYRDRFEPVSMEHVVVDNSDGMEATLRQVDDHF